MGGTEEEKALLGLAVFVVGHLGARVFELVVVSTLAIFVASITFALALVVATPPRGRTGDFATAERSLPPEVARFMLRPTASELEDFQAAVFVTMVAGGDELAA